MTIKLDIRKPKTEFRAFKSLIAFWVISTLDTYRVGATITPPVVPQN